MTSLRRRSRIVAVAIIAMGAALSLAPSASAATVEGSGWWWRPNTTTAPIDVPPRADVSADQLLVEGTAEGATAVAAAHFKLADGESSPILTITASQDSAVPAGSVVLGCRVGSSWQPAQGGKWELKPIPDCFTSVQGIPSDGGKITFALTPLQSGPDLEVVIVPGNNPAPANDNAKGSAFTLKFAKPTAADLKTTTDSSGAFAGTGGGFSSPDPQSFGAEPSNGSSFDSGSSFDGGSAATSGSSFGSGSSFAPSPAFSQPSSFAPPAAVVPAASPSLSANEQVNAQGAVPVQAAPAANTTSAPRKGRTLGIIVLLAGAALGFWAYSGNALGGGGVPAPVPVVVATGEPVIGGLGRFSRPRSGPPPSLS